MRLPLNTLLTALSAVACLALSGPVRADPVVWRVTDADTEMLLVGSIHALPGHIEWRTAELDAAVAAAELVVFEVLTPETDAEELALYGPLFQYMLGRAPLSEVVCPEVWSRLEAALAPSGTSTGQLEFLRPWAAAIMVESLISEDAGSVADLGVDMVIEMSLRPDQRKLALDTPELLKLAFGSFAALSDAEGEAMLVETLDWLEEEDVESSWLMEEAWAAGDVAALAEEAALMKAEAPQIYEALMVVRNNGWMPALSQIMATERRVVVVVGALHLVGPDGLPTLLRAAGYTVEGP